MTDDPVKLRLVISLGQKMREAQRKALEQPNNPKVVKEARDFESNFDFAAAEATKP